MVRCVLRLFRQWAEFFEDFDVLLCPVMPTAAFEHDHDMSGGGANRRLTINGQRTPYFESVRWAGAPPFFRGDGVAPRVPRHHARI
jgi:Asp-tRNA(Asn)/Glu-tRNA(Gln) amidotransferase A subunit family amidase